MKQSSWNPIITKVIFLSSLLLALVLPLIHIASGFGYAGDQGRDLIEVYTHIKNHSIPLVGPGASVGSFHVGPLYYFLLAPGMILFHYSPLSPIALTVLINVAVVFVGYRLLREFGNRTAALVFAVLAALSPYLIFLARGSWNPNPQTLAALLLLYTTMQFIHTKQSRYLLWIGAVLGCGIQLHYTFLSNAFTILLVLAVLQWRVLTNWRTYLYPALGSLIALTPFLIGQILLNGEDLRGLAHYLLISQFDPASFFSLHGFLLHAMTPFHTFYAIDLHPGWMGPAALVLWASILLACLHASLTKGPLAQLARVSLVFYAASLLQAHSKNLDLPHYYLFFNIVVLILASVSIAHLLNQRHVRVLGGILLAALLGWSCIMLPTSYGVGRDPRAVQAAANVIKTRLLQEDQSQPKLYLASPISGWEAFEYRYLLDKEGYHSSFAFSDTADFFIVESKTDSSPEVPGFNLIKRLSAGQKSQAIASISIYERIK